jgi:uncharacterized membrane protein
MDLAEPGECMCQFWRPLVASLILAPGVASLREPVENYGVEPSFQRRLGAVLPPGSSAVFMIVPRRLLNSISAELESVNGTLIASPIRKTPSSHARRLEAAARTKLHHV